MAMLSQTLKTKMGGAQYRFLNITTLIRSTPKKGTLNLGTPKSQGLLSHEYEVLRIPMRHETLNSNSLFVATSLIQGLDAHQVVEAAPAGNLLRT